MAILTAEDVLNKAFSKTKYREGFDQDEVDDFLDEVANSISALTAERDELQSRLSQYQAGGAPVASSAHASGEGAPASVASSSADLLSAATDPNPPSATTMLSMAQRLHDDYVQAGEAERERIIDEGKAKAESIVEQAEKDAQVRLQTLDTDRADLERRIDDLRRFERDYRGHLRNYLENLLGDLEHDSARGPSASFGAEAGAAAPHETPEPPTPEPFVPTMTGFDSGSSDGESFSEAPTPSAPEPFAAAPFAPPAQATPFDEQVAPVPPVLADPEALPPFPGSSGEETAYRSPFADANSFAPESGATPVLPVLEANEDPNAHDEPKSDEEAPRWNF